MERAGSLKNKEANKQKTKKPSDQIQKTSGSADWADAVT